MPRARYFKPVGIPLREMDIVELTVGELETLRLVDMEGLTQEDAARRMGISRRTLWKDLMNARRKVAAALVNGMAIQIAGDTYRVIGNKDSSSIDIENESSEVEE